MKIVIVGFGMMGRQIAQVFAQHGHDVAVTDENPEAVTAGLKEVEEGPYGFQAAHAKGKLTRKEVYQAVRRIRAARDLDDACMGADLVIEAVFEALLLKQEIFARLESAAPPDALLASNTSTLTVSKIGSRVTRKDRVLGMHFFNPAQVTKLVEIGKTSQTSTQAVQEASKIVETIGKIPIVSKDEPGFIANRLGLTLYMEASRLVEEGTAEIRDVDLAMKLGYNHPMGPFELADFVGLDTRVRNLEALFESTGDEKWIPPKTLREMVNQGYLGDPHRRKGSLGGYYEFFKISRREPSNSLYARKKRQDLIRLPFNNILVETEPPIGIIRLNRPKVLNALNFELLRELVEALEAFDKDDRIRATVLTGNDDAFSAGADIKELSEATPVDLIQRNQFALWDRLKKTAKPIIGAISGHALGGGCELAMNCDIIIASETARFGQPEINIGIMPGAGGTQRLTRTIGKYRAMEMILTGQSITAREAESHGLVNRIVPVEAYFEEAKKLAMQIAQKAPVATRMAKEAVLKAFDTPLEEGLQFERRNFYLLFSTEDMKEGMKAFTEKRPAKFKGR